MFFRGPYTSKYNIYILLKSKIVLKKSFASVHGPGFVTKFLLF